MHRRRLSPLWLLTLPVLVAPAGAMAAPAPPPPPSASSDAPASRPASRPAAAPGNAPTPAPAPAKAPSGAGADPFADGGTADMSPTTDLSREWGYARGGEQRPRYVTMEDESVASTPNPIGFYSGVSMERSDTVVPWAPADPSTAAPTLTWPGFERTPNSSKVFFQISRGVSHELSQDGTKITVRFPGTVVDVKNNRRPLVLTYHKTPVSRVVVRRSGSDAVATITLKRAATPSVTTRTENNGYQLIVLEFGDDEVAATEP